MPPRSIASHGKGPIDATRKDLWVLAAKRALLDLVERELALVAPELDARLGDTGVTLDRKPHFFDPHIITEASHQLLADGLTAHELHRTRGGATVEVIVPTDQARRRTAISKSAGRKAMLYRRFLALSNTAGDAGELVLRTSLTSARDAGAPYIPMERRFGEVSRVLGSNLHGPLDSGAFLHHVDTNGIPGLPIAVPIEVKNRRLTLYPIHKEVHQLLAKAAAVQHDNPDYPIAPVLICRKAHARLFWMASNLGFRVWATRRQFVFATKDIDERKIAEVRDELGIQDLVVVDRAKPPGIEKFLRESLPNQARLAADDWAAYAETVAPYSEALRTDDLTPRERIGLVIKLRDEVVELHREWSLDPPYTWAVSEEESTTESS